MRTHIQMCFRLSIIAAFGVMISTAPAAAAATHEQAAKLMEVSGDGESIIKGQARIQATVSKMIAVRVGASDPTASAKVAAVVSETLSPVPPKVIAATVAAYAANFSNREIDDVLAFMDGPGGRAEKTNLPLLRAALAAALIGQVDPSSAPEAIDRALAAAPALRRQLIARVFKAQDLEGQTRKDYMALLGGARAVVTAIDTAHTLPPARDDPATLAHAADDYVRMVMGVEKRFYLDHFSDAELVAMADYLESEAGRAMLTGAPLVKRAVGQVMRDQVVAALASLNTSVCSAVACSPQQRKELADLISAAGAGVTASAGLLP